MSKPQCSSNSVGIELTVAGRFNDFDGRSSDDLGIDLLNKMAGRISGGASLGEVLSDLVAFVKNVTACDVCLVYVLEKDELVLRAPTSLGPPVVDRVKLETVPGTLDFLERLETVFVSKGAHRDFRIRSFNEQYGDRFEAFMAVPTVSGGKSVGVIIVQHRVERSDLRRHISLITTLSFLVGAEIERTRLKSENVRLLEQLECRKIIERAKGILQRDLCLTEEQAYLALRRKSQNLNKTMKEVAAAVLLSDDLRCGR